MKITLSEFYTIPIYDYFLRIIFHGVTVFDEDKNTDLIENYILPIYGDKIIKSIECFNGTAYYDGVIFEIKLED